MVSPWSKPTNFQCALGLIIGLFCLYMSGNEFLNGEYFRSIIFGVGGFYFSSFYSYNLLNKKKISSSEFFNGKRDFSNSKSSQGK